MKKIILITGGQRSGKSRYAEQIALAASDNPVYLATSRIWDDEHRRRIEHHKAHRDHRWTNMEEEKRLSAHQLEGRTALVDCITLWATNYFYDLEADVDRALREMKDDFDAFTAQDALFIFVTNEIGMGETPQNELQRRFSDLQGWINQYVAERADEVYFMVAGIAVKIK